MVYLYYTVNGLSLLYCSVIINGLNYYTVLLLSKRVYLYYNVVVL